MRCERHLAENCTHPRCVLIERCSDQLMGRLGDGLPVLAQYEDLGARWKWDQSAFGEAWMASVREFYGRRKNWQSIVWSTAHSIVNRLALWMLSDHAGHTFEAIWPFEYRWKRMTFVCWPCRGRDEKCWYCDGAGAVVQWPGVLAGLDRLLERGERYGWRWSQVHEWRPAPRPRVALVW